VSVLQQKELQKRIQHVEGLISAVGALEDESARQAAVDAIQALLELHGDGFERIIRLTRNTGPAGESLVHDFARDDLVANLLLLHGVHPQSLEERVKDALDKVAPYLASHGGSVDLLDVTEGVVKLKLQGSCHGCPSSAMTLKYAIEEGILDTAPDVVAIEVDGAVDQPAEPAGFVALGVDGDFHGPLSRGWQTVAGLESLEVGGARVTDVAGSAILFCRANGNWYAYHDPCPSCSATFADAILNGVVLTCPGCAHKYDIRGAGRCLEDPRLRLTPLPLLVEKGEVRVAAPTPAPVGA